MRWASRALPLGVRHLTAACCSSPRRARKNELLRHSTGRRRGERCSAARLRVRPFVAKLTQGPGLRARRLRCRLRFRGAASVKSLRSGRPGCSAPLAIGEVRRAAARIVCPSSFLAGLVRGWGVAANRNSRDPEPGAAALGVPRPRWTAPRGCRGLAFAGRLHGPQGAGVLREAVAQAPGVQLELAGDGDERAALEARSHELGLDGRVTSGTLPREECAVALPSRGHSVPVLDLGELPAHARRGACGKERR